MTRALLGALLLWWLASPASAQAPNPPPAAQVVNQGVAARLLTKSDTVVLQRTRGIFIGDATACNVALLFIQDTAAVTFLNVQSGAIYPFQIKKLMSANTTCTSVIALY